jgi:DNA-binding GntR family transcriptional regulator
MPVDVAALPFPPAPVRRSASEPLYAQVARDLAAHVRRGTMAPGQRLPAEPVLAEAYGVNRLTVREALGSLARQGLIRRVQGVGSFVADAPVRHRVDARAVDLTTAMRRRGLAVREDVLEVAPAPAEAVPGGPFSAFPGPVTILWIRRVVDDVPWSLTLTWLPAALAGRDLPLGPDTTLRTLIERRHGLRIHGAERIVAAAPAAPSDAEQLDIATGAPLIVLSGDDADHHGRRIAQVSERIRGDRAEYAVDLRAPERG